ncbi:MAG: hypothetical protein ABSH08_21020, partial [Tepidisphaeraceae bacterium]
MAAVAEGGFEIGVALLGGFEGIVGVSRGAPKPASAGRSKPASAVTHIPHPFGSLQLSIELLALH